ncbi:TetR/AcrR family transcriptional regulator [Novosphingobium sp. UBA1939]|uniref:TetR/AcrR family transcriptional regulator n=1 Tax=Novosphingobium sp. UBA1939 TaxID=1946982 RepID=UPI0025F7EE1C|nr:TetR/AcrR family transcriptional regulator [Novosphingobium sp. UBA1939]
MSIALDAATEKAKAPRKRREQKRAVETRERIIRAAGAEFAAKGFDGAATRSIAAAAGVQHTLVTYHFGGKEGLWQETLRFYSHERFEQLQSRLDGLRGVGAATKLYLYMDDFVRYSAECPEFAWIMGNVAAKPNPQLEWLFETQLSRGFSAVETMIEGAQKTGHFVDGEPRYLYYLFIGTVTRIFMLSAEVEKMLGRSPFDPDFVAMHAKTCLGLFFRNQPSLEPY